MTFNRLDLLNDYHRKILTTFIVSGDSANKNTVECMHMLVENGVDVLELGMPFSEPEAEGVVIQSAVKRSLTKGHTLYDVFDRVSSFRETNQVTPIVLMGYLNPILSMGIKHFVNACKNAGVDAVLIVNLPIEYAQALKVELEKNQIYLILLIAQTTTLDRIEFISTQAKGFVYLVALKGVTGASIDENTVDIDLVDSIRKYTQLPVLIGFGVKSPDHARLFSLKSDGVVVGTALIHSLLEKQVKFEKTASFITSLRKAMDQ